MWLNGVGYHRHDFPEDEPASSFSQWIGEVLIDRRTEEDEHRDPITVMGTIELWMNLGCGFDYFSDYASFLQFVLHVVFDWYGAEQKEVGGHPLRDDTGRIPLLPVPPHFETDERYGFSNPWQLVYPLMNPAWFAYGKGSRQATLAQMIGAMHEERFPR